MRKPIRLLLLLISVLILDCATLKQARRSYNEKDYRQTIRLCKEAIAADSTHAQAYLLLGKSYHALDSLDAALKATERAYQLHPDSPEILSGYVQLHIDLGDRSAEGGMLQKALAHYTSAETAWPAHTTALRRIADLHYQNGRLDAATSKYERLRLLTPDSASVIQRLTDIQARTRKAQSLHQQGLSAETKKNFRTARSLFTKALSEKPDFTDAQYHLSMTQGILLYKKGSKSALWDAIEAFGKAMSLRPDAAEPHFHLGQAYEKKSPDEFVNAIDEYETALRLDPEGPLASTYQKKIKELKNSKEKMDNFWGKGK